LGIDLHSGLHDEFQTMVHFKFDLERLKGVQSCCGRRLLLDVDGVA
jgi:hypothetical protein